jgi:hypothetical protein
VGGSAPAALAPPAHNAVALRIGVEAVPPVRGAEAVCPAVELSGERRLTVHRHAADRIGGAAAPDAHDCVIGAATLQEREARTDELMAAVGRLLRRS